MELEETGDTDLPFIQDLVGKGDPEPGQGRSMSKSGYNGDR